MHLLLFLGILIRCDWNPLALVSLPVLLRKYFHIGDQRLNPLLHPLKITPDESESYIAKLSCDWHHRKPFMFVQIWQVNPNVIKGHI